MQRFALLLPAFLAAGLAFPASAQVTVAPAASAASVPEARPARRPLSGDALRDSGTFPDDMQPEAPKPQIKVPLGRKPPGPAAAASDAAKDGTAVRAAPKINDEVARCKAQPTAGAREACLGRLTPADGAAPKFGR